MGGEVDAGKAVVHVVGEDSGVSEVIAATEKRLKDFARNTMALGAKVGGLGIAIGASLLAAAKSFSQSSEEMSQKLGVNISSGDIEASKELASSFDKLGASVGYVVGKIGSTMAPAINNLTSYVVEGAKVVGQFIEANKLLAPQALAVAGALIAAGFAISSLGVSFFVAGPIIKLAMIGATAASLAFASVMGTVNLSVLVANASLKVASASTVVFTAAQYAGVAASKVFAVALGTIGLAGRAVLASLAAASLAISLLTGGYRTALGAVFALSSAHKVYTFAVTAATAATAVFNAVLVGLTSPIGIAVVAIAALAASGASLQGVFDYIGKAGKDLFQYLSDKAGVSLPFIKGTFFDTFKAIGAYVTDAIAPMKRFFFDLLGTAKQTFQGVSNAIAAGDMKSATAILWTGIKLAWSQGVDAIKSTWDYGMIYVEASTDKVSQAIHHVWAGLDTAWVLLTTSIEGAWDQLATKLKSIWDSFSDHTKRSIDSFVNYMTKGLLNVTAVAGKIANVVNPLMTAGDRQEANKAIDDKLAKDKAALDANAVAKAARDAAIGGKPAGPNLEQRGNARTERLAKSGDTTAVDAEMAKRAAERNARKNNLDSGAIDSEETTKLKAELAALNENIKNLKSNTPELPPGFTPQAIQSSYQALDAKVSGSAAVASAVTRAASGATETIPVQTLAEMKKVVAELKVNTKAIKDNPAVMISEVS